MSTQDRFRYADSVEGVDIEKRYDETEFPFPSVVYDFVSNRDETVTLSVEDVLTEAVDAENVGFHADYNGDDWAVDGNRLRFERELPPDAECRTIYAVSATETEDPSDIFVEPSSIDVSPTTSDGGPSIDEAVHRSEPAQTVSIPDGRGGDPHTEGSAAPSTDGDGDLFEALASEVDSNRVDPNDLDVLASAVADAMGDAAGSVDARLSRIESDVAELRAYSDALADFLDENGGAQAMLEKFEQRISTLESDLDALRSQTEDIEGGMASLRSETETLEGDLETLSDSHDDLWAEIDELQSTLGHTADGASVTDRLGSLEDRMTEFEEFVGSVRAAFE